MLNISCKPPADKAFTSQINRKYRKLRKVTPKYSYLSRPISVAEINDAMIDTKNGKAAGYDAMYPEFLTHSGPKTRLWLSRFYSNIIATNVLPHAFKIAKVIALLKPEKPENLPESYRPIALLSVPLKFFERLIYNRINPEIGQVIQPEQAGFTKGRSCSDQVLALTNYIESGFERVLKTGVVLIDLSAAYDTVWKKGLMYKLVKVLPCLQLCDVICNILSDRYFQVLLDDKLSSTKKLNNGLPQGSVLACILFNLYIHDLPPSMSRKFLYADDKAYAYQHKNFRTINKVLTKDMTSYVQYCKNWRLVPNLTKTVVSCFHLNNQCANVQLRVIFDGKILKHTFDPVYLGIKLDRSLTFKKHAEKLEQKLSARINLLKKLAGTTWGATGTCLRTSTLALVYSTAEYCCSSWINSVHTKKIDVILSQAMRLITGTVASTPTEWLPALCNIAPPAIRRQTALVREYQKVLSNPNLPLYDDLLYPPVPRLVSRKPPVIYAKRLIESDFHPQSAWRDIWASFGAASPLFTFENYTSRSNDFDIPRTAWKNLNRLRTGHGRCNDLLFKWKYIDDPACECGYPKQTTNHILNGCPILSYQGQLQDIVDLKPNAIQWLTKLEL